ncbi:MAG: cytochrome-c peroxidase [Rubinisphaera brasiliensis]|uniref:cytochrome-c peroxidase n=1 Tax=Rubinisphaera brasiliensis TaxID=119 RepID=UPI003919D098
MKIPNVPRRFALAALASLGFAVACDLPVQAASKSDAKSNRVTLGQSGLVGGIPGEGPLTNAEIKKWLADPANHETLEVVLPLGLNVANIPEGVLEANPLTRAKVELGRQLYFDTRLSVDNTISCASCHDPEVGWAANTQFGVGIEGLQGNRNSPVSYNRILTKEQFWDGRAASLEDQAIGPIANPIEMGNTHEAAVGVIGKIPGYRLQFESIFGKDGVTIENVGKALAAFERVIVTNPTPYDYYEQLKPFSRFEPEDIEDDPDLKEMYDEAAALSAAHPMSESAIRGRDLFFSERVNCAACHVGANLADEKYYNLGVGMDKENPDLGRYEVTGKEEDKGAFKTPTIRNVAQTAPYMHDGSLKTLMDVVEHYNKGGIPNPHLSDKIVKLNLTEQEKKDLVAFMEACTGEFEEVEPGRLPK